MLFCPRCQVCWSLIPSPPPPFFEGVEPRTWTPNRFYRVYILPSELIFIRAGSAGEINAVVAGQFGLLGALIAAATNPSKKNEERRKEMDNSNLNDLVESHKHNFIVPINEVESAILDPMSFYLATWYQHPHHVGVLRFKHASRGVVRIAISSTEEMKTAFEVLPSVFGDRLAVNVEWSEKKNRFVRKRS